MHGRPQTDTAVHEVLIELLRREAAQNQPPRALRNESFAAEIQTLLALCGDPTRTGKTVQDRVTTFVSGLRVLTWHCQIVNPRNFHFAAPFTVPVAGPPVEPGAPSLTWPKGLPAALEAQVRIFPSCDRINANRVDHFVMPGLATKRADGMVEVVVKAIVWTEV